LRVLSAETGGTQYLSKTTFGPYSTMHLADIQGDSRPELIVSVGRDDDAEERIIVLDAETGLQIRRVSSPPFAMTSSASVLDSFDLEQDGKKEIVVGAFQSVALIDGTTLNVRWSAPIENAGVLRQLKLMRFNTDSVDDIVICTSERVLIVDGRNGSELYRSPVIIDGGAHYDIVFGNMDNDAQTEIAISLDQAIHVVDPYSGETRLLHTPAQIVIGLRFEDTGVCTLVLVTKDKLERRRCTNGSLISTRNLPHGDAKFVSFAGTSFDDLVTSDGQSVYRVRGDEIVARSTLLGTSMGKFNQGVIRVNGTSITSYIGGDQGVSRVDLPFELLFRDGFDQR
jgi:hypothetical protein